MVRQHGSRIDGDKNKKKITVNYFTHFQILRAKRGVENKTKSLDDDPCLHA